MYIAVWCAARRLSKTPRNQMSRKVKEIQDASRQLQVAADDLSMKMEDMHVRCSASSSMFLVIGQIQFRGQKLSPCSDFLSFVGQAWRGKGLECRELPSISSNQPSLTTSLRSCLYICMWEADDCREKTANTCWHLFLTLLPSRNVLLWWLISIFPCCTEGGETRESHANICTPSEQGDASRSP